MYSRERIKIGKSVAPLVIFCLALLGFATIDAKVALAQSGVDVTINQASVFGGGGGPPTTPVTDTATVTIYDLPMVAVSKRLQSIDPLQVGDPAHFTIMITNTGTITLSNLTLEDRYSGAFITYDAGNTAPAHTAAASGIVTWDALLPAAGLAPNQSIAVDVYFTAANDTTLLAPLAPCTKANAAPNLARLLNMQADPDGAGPLPAVDLAEQQSCDSVRIFNPTGILLAEKSIVEREGGILVRWSTAVENDIAGFHIWRLRGLEAERRTSTLIPAQQSGQATGASYQWLDVGARLSSGEGYLLEIVYADGTSERIVIASKLDTSLFLPLIAN